MSCYCCDTKQNAAERFIGDSAWVSMQDAAFLQWYMSPEPVANQRPAKCAYCGSRDGVTRCKSCGAPKEDR